MAPAAPATGRWEQLCGGWSPLRTYTCLIVASPLSACPRSTCICLSSGRYTPRCELAAELIIRHAQIVRTVFLIVMRSPPGEIVGFRAVGNDREAYSY